MPSIDYELHEKMGRVLAKLEAIEKHLHILNGRTDSLEEELDSYGRGVNNRLDTHILQHEKEAAIQLAKKDILFSRSGASKLFAVIALIGAASASISRITLYLLEAKLN